MGGLAGSGNIGLADGSHAVTLSVGGNGTCTTYSGGLSGAGGLTKTGGGVLVLCGSNTYTGGTTVAAGTLKLDFSQAGAPTANIINNATNASSLTLAGGILAIQGKLSTTNSQQFNGLTVNPGCSAIVLTAGTANPLLLSLGSIARSTGGTVDFTLPSGTQSGSNGITTTTPNTAAGILGGYATVSGTDWACSTGTAGNITAYSAYTYGDLGALGSGSMLNVSPSGSQSTIASATSFNTLNLTGTEGVTMTGSGSLTLLGGGLIGNTSGTISGGTLAGSASGELIVITPANFTIGSVIADNGGPTALTKAGSAMLTLIGSNTYSGVTTIGAGTLQIGNGGASGSLGTGPVTDISTLAFNLSGAQAYGGAISGNGSLTQVGVGILTLTGSNTYTGGTTISAGTLQVGNGNAAALGPGTLTDNSALVFNLSGIQTFSGAINGSGSLTLVGTGLLTLTGSNTFTGGTTISAGTLEVGNAASTLGAGPLTDNSVLVLNLSGAQTFGGVINGSGSLTQTGAGMLTLTGSNTYTGGTTISTGTLQVGNGNATAALGPGSLTDNSALVFNSSVAQTFGGAVSGSGSLTQAGTGILTLTASNTYTGGTALAAGELSISSSANLSAGGPILFNGGTLQITGTAVAGIGNYSSVNWTAFNGGFDIANAANVFAVNNVISGTGSLSKVGAGTLLLTAANSYSGATTIGAGTLRVGGTGTLAQVR